MIRDRSLTVPAKRRGRLFVRPDTGYKARMPAGFRQRECELTAAGTFDKGKCGLPVWEPDVQPDMAGRRVDYSRESITLRFRYSCRYSLGEKLSELLNSRLK